MGRGKDAEANQAMPRRRPVVAAFLFSVSGLKFYELFGGTLPSPLTVVVDWTLAGVVLFALYDLIYRHYKARARTDGAG